MLTSKAIAEIADAIIHLVKSHVLPTRKRIVQQIVKKCPELNYAELDLDVAKRLNTLVAMKKLKRVEGKYYIPTLCHPKHEEKNDDN